MTQLRTLVREPQAGGRAASVTTTRQGAGGTTPASRARPELDYELRHWLRHQLSDLYLARARELEADEEPPPAIPGVCYRPACSQPFDLQPQVGFGGGNRKFCSDKCRKRHNNDLCKQRLREAR